MCLLMFISLSNQAKSQAKRIHITLRKNLLSTCVYMLLKHVCDCSVISLQLRQVYIASATGAHQTEGPCLRHASHAEQGSKLGDSLYN